jgi:hypothetical protein
MNGFYDMTFPALSARADEVNVRDCVADYIGGGDLRQVTVFLAHEQRDQGEDYGYKLVSNEIIGVALCDLDDPQAAVEVLTRDEANALFGWQRLEDWEEVE